MTSSLPLIGVGSSSPQLMTSSLSLPVMATYGNRRQPRQRPRRDRSAHEVRDRDCGRGRGGDMVTSNCTGTGSGIPLVDMPRRIMAENTIIESDTHFALHLERFYKAVVSVSADQLNTARDRTDTLLRQLLPRVAKLGVKIGLRLIGSVKTGSVYDGTCVICADEVDVLVMFDTYQVRTLMASPGYVIIPLDGAETSCDWRFGWSRDHTHLSPVTVSKTLHKLVRRVHTTQPPECWKILPFEMHADRSPVTVAYEDDSLFVNLIPACAVSSRPGDVTYVVARPYAYDLDRSADFLWRLSTVERESRILDQMDRSK